MGNTITRAVVKRKTMREQLLTVTVDWADHEQWCPSIYKVVYCFVCKAEGKIEDNMPTPEGQITGSNIWTGQPLQEDEKNYRVTFTCKTRKTTVVTAKSREEAEERAGFRVSANKNEYDELISNYEVEITEEV